MTIQEFYAQKISKIKYTSSAKPICCVRDFYEDFLVAGRRLPEKEVIEQWHDLLVAYLNEPDAVYFVRKYEAGKEGGEWNNRRGAVIQFEDGTQIVYASNFLAHEIFLMAYHGFVPTLADWKDSIKNRTLHITSGTKIEKKIRLYPSANKVLSYCYLAHIMDVNGQYLRDDKTYTKLSSKEEESMYPRGSVTDWTASADKIWHLPQSKNLSAEQKELVKAHCLRFLDPMNYYLTPLTNQSTHTISGFTKNIGEYPHLTYYIQQQYRKIFGSRYDELITLGRFVEKQPSGFTETKTINLTYSNLKKGTSAKKPTSAPAASGKRKAPTKPGGVPIVQLKPADPELFKKELLHKKKAKRTWKYSDGTEAEDTWNAEGFSASSKLMNNIRSTGRWRTREKDGLVSVVIEV